MTTLAGLSIGELAAFIADHLRARGIDVVLVGGACVCIYSDNEYRSFDLDFITTGITSRRTIRLALEQIGFTEEQRYFKHPETEYFIEFPSGPLAIGDEPPGEIAVLSYPTGMLRLLSPTDSVKDRLAAYYHWKDRQSLEQAVLVAAGHPVDMDEVRRWSAKEGFATEFEAIRERFKHGRSGWASVAATRRFCKNNLRNVGLRDEPANPTYDLRLAKGVLKLRNLPCLHAR